jgi:hypothetical protein
MPPLPLPTIPWQLTGNHWLSLPCIHPGDGSLHRVGVLHRGARAALEFAAPSSAPLLRLGIEVDGETVALGANGLAWERALLWIPTFTSAPPGLLVRGAVFCPFGRDADLAGAVYTITLENRGSSSRRVTVSLASAGGHLESRVRMARPPIGALSASVHGDAVVLDSGIVPGMASLALTSDGDTAPWAGEHGACGVSRTATLAAGEQAELAFYIAAGPEPDGALATAAAMRRRGWRALLDGTRSALAMLQQATGSESYDRLLNRNLLFAYFYGVARALDDAHFYVMRSRVPWHSAGLTVRDWDMLTSLIPAIQICDPPLARELLLRMCELHGYAPGRGVHYVDGTLFEPAFSLEGAAAYAIAVDEYVSATRDDRILEDPVVSDTMYLVHDELADRRHAEFPLYATEVTPSGAAAPLPFTAHASAVASIALDALKRLLDEETAREAPDGEAVRVALLRSFMRGTGAKRDIVTALNLGGEESKEDDPVGSMLSFPIYRAVDGEDRLVSALAKFAPEPGGALVRRIARASAEEGEEAFEWLRRAPLDGGIAAEVLDERGRAIANGGDAILAAELARLVWSRTRAEPDHGPEDADPSAG